MADELDTSKINAYTLTSPYPEGDVASKINGYSLVGASADDLEASKINIYTLVGPAEPGIGDIIQIGCAKIRVTSRPSAIRWIGEVLQPLELILPDDPDLTPKPVEEWKLLPEVQEVSGLEHLEDKEVWALADGQVVGPMRVEDGAVDLGFEASSVVVGLKYVQQIKTLYLTNEGMQRGSEQGKRKFLQGVTLRLDCTRGIQTGLDFEYLTAVPDTILAGEPLALFQGDAYTTIHPDWNTKGEVCIQQQYPLPAQVLGVIVGVTAGDTGS